MVPSTCARLPQVTQVKSLPDEGKLEATRALKRNSFDRLSEERKGRLRSKFCNEFPELASAPLTFTLLPLTLLFPELASAPLRITRESKSVAMRATTAVVRSERPAVTHIPWRTNYEVFSV